MGERLKPQPLRHKASGLTLWSNVGFSPNQSPCPTISYCESDSRLSHESAIILSQTMATIYLQGHSKSQLTYLAMPGDKMADHWSTRIRIFQRRYIKTERISRCKSMNQKIKEPAAGGIRINDVISMAILIRKP